MAVIKNEFPILEYSTTYEAVINPGPGEIKFPSLCLLTFFGEVMRSFVDVEKGEIIGTCRSAMGNFDVYRVTYCKK